ncbi:hypothetical protein KIN20_005489 [Parelaphostrongylus tenuis]|uniref:Uncharacterized protein n=1 Tax=Parelaphostrongylus tenuis TaxID=148309 RepID=A0AAD5MIS2_PARTN|nr:hypothetical protein KIN20_005489 [Parelaphostrongylus tenuis]
MNRSFDVNPPTTCYGDDFVETARRLRRSRLNLSNGRTKSAEFGQNGGYLHDLRDSPRLCTTIPPPVAYAGSQTDSGSDLLFGRRSEAYASTGRRNPQEYSLQQRRPQSSFGPRGAVQRFKRFGGHHGSYDICDGEAPSSISDVAHSDEEGDSEGEMARYTLEGRNGGPSDVTDVQTVAGEESYYFGVIHLDQSRVRSILHNFPPPVDYYRLPPIEKAAYLFYVAVYKKLYRDVGDFI